MPKAPDDGANPAVSPAGKGSVRRPVYLFLRVAVTSAAFFYIAGKLDFAGLKQRFLNADPIWIAFACAALGAAYLLASARWWFLLRVQRVEISLRAVTAITFIGQFFNVFMLGSIGGDFVKSLYVLKYAPRQRTHATLSILLDRVLGLFILLFASIVSVPFGPTNHAFSPDTRDVFRSLIAIFLLLLITAIALATLPFHRAPAWIIGAWNRIPYRHLGGLIIGGFRAHFRALPDLAGAMITGVLVTVTLVLAGCWIARSIGCQVPALDMLQILTVAICIISLPISIGGHGVRESAFVFLFVAYGITLPTADGSGVAVLFSLVFFLLSSVWSLVGGLVYLAFKPVPSKLPGPE
jgi:uncharacterized protein (TIRG00374 family)